MIHFHFARIFNLFHLPALFISLILPVIGFGIAWSENIKKPIVIATIDYPPLMGTREGIMTDLAREAFKAVDIPITFIIVPMSRIEWIVSNANTDAAVGSMDWIHNDSAKSSLKHTCIFYTGFHFFYLKNKFPNGLKFDDICELKHHRIGYIRGGALSPIFEQKGIKPDWVADLSRNARKLFLNRIDMFAATEISGWTVINNHYPEYSHKLAMDTHILKDIYGDVIFGPNQSDLHESFQIGFDIIKENGTFLNIFKSYYGSENVPGWARSQIR